MYLITFCCHERRATLRNGRYALEVVEEIFWSDKSGASRTVAFVVMPDHVHWLLALGPRLRMSTVVGQLKGRAAMRINRAAGTRGQVWQQGFHDHALRAGEDLESVGQYVIHNPVRAGMVERPQDYPFCGLGADLQSRGYLSRAGKFRRAWVEGR